MKCVLILALPWALLHAQPPPGPTVIDPHLKMRPSGPEPTDMNGPDGHPDPRLASAGATVSDAAKRFSQTAQQFYARETLHQRAIKSGSIRKKKGDAVVMKGAPQYDQRQINSFYAFTTVGKSAVIREIREVLTVDKETLAKEFDGRKQFREALLTRDDEAKTKMLSTFDLEGLHGVATDLGQMILLFDRKSIGNFGFERDREENIGNIRAMVLRYTQRQGTESVRINESGKHLTSALKGWLWLRLPDYLPLRITMISTHAAKKHEVRDEAEVDYAENANGALLPSSVIHRRFEDDILAAEDEFRYSDWQTLK